MTPVHVCETETDNTTAPVEAFRILPYNRDIPHYIGPKNISHENLLNNYVIANTESREINSVYTKIRGAIVYDRAIYVGKDQYIFESRRDIDQWFMPLISNDELMSKPSIRLNGDENYMYLGSAGSPNWGHWLVDDLPRALRAAASTHFVIQSYGEPFDRNRSDCLRILFGPEVSVTLIPPGHSAHFAELQFVSPLTHHPIIKSGEALQELKKRMLPASVGKRDRKLAVTRGDSPFRNLTDGGRLMDSLKARGFEVLDTATMNAADQIRTFSEASHVVGIMGAAMTNTIFSAPETNIVYLSPEGWVEPFYWDLAAVMGHRYKCVYGLAQTGYGHSHLEGFAVPLAEVERALQA